MGNESSNPIRNMDKRTARREYRESFTKAIEDFQLENNANPDAHPQTEEEMLAEHAERDLKFDGVDGSGKQNNVRVVVRKRPIFKHEQDGHEFDVVSCLEGRTAVIHDTRMHADMRRMLITNNAFAFDGVFHERATNEMVYQSAAKPLVKEAVHGGFATVCVYGQTGSGKSFTMTSIYEKAAHEIFRELDSNNDRMYAMPRISMSFFELQGETCLDLLNCFTPTALLTASDGGVHAHPVVEPTVGSAEEMIAMIHHALSIRSTSATGVHDASSRSHAILRIYIEQPLKELTEGEEMMRRDMGMSGKPGPLEGVLTLVDLAGSEQSIDSMYHTAELRKEGAAINSSLMALKDCIRAKASGNTATHIYRKSKLTMALKDSFVLPTARTVIVATVSPSSKDTEHSLNTLRHACLMDGQSQKKDASGETEQRFMTGGTKSETYQIGEVNVTEISRKNRELRKKGEGPLARTSSGNYLGKDVTKVKQNGPMTKPPPELTEKQKAKARRLADRQGLHRLAPPTRELLLGHRERLGQEEQQLHRMKRTQNPYIPAPAPDPRDMSQSPPPGPPPGPPPSQWDRDGKPFDMEDYMVNCLPGGSEEPEQYGSRQGQGQQYRISNTNERSPRGSHDFARGDLRASTDSTSTGGGTTPRRPLSARLTAPTAAAAKRQLETDIKRRALEQRKAELREEEQRLEDEEEEELQNSLARVQNSPPEKGSVDASGQVGYENQFVEQRQQQQQPGPVDTLTPYWKLYVQVFGRQVEHHDHVTKETMNRQLQTVMRMHGYGDDAITKLIASGRPAIPTRPKKPAAVAEQQQQPDNGDGEQQQQEQQQPPRKSHMSSYGGHSNANGARNESVHNTVQANETRVANVRGQPSKERPSVVAARNKSAGLQSAAQKLDAEAKLREERRSRAKAVSQAKDEAAKEVAREKNRVDMQRLSELQMQHAAEQVDKEAAIKEKRRQNAKRVIAQKEAEVKRNAQQRLDNKGMSEGSSNMGNVGNSPQHNNDQYGGYEPTNQLPLPAAAYEPRSPPAQERRKRVDTSAEDAEIGKLTRQVINARYQPVDVQAKLKRQLSLLKTNKYRKEKGEPPLPASPETEEPVNNTKQSLHTRPGSAGAQRPNSAGNRMSSPRGSNSGSSYSQSANATRQSSSRDAQSPYGARDRPNNREQMRNNQRQPQQSHSQASFDEDAREVKMPTQLRREVRGNNNGGGGYVEAERDIGHSGIEKLSNIDQYNHSSKRPVVAPHSPQQGGHDQGQRRAPMQNSPSRSQPTTNVHLQGRPQDSRGGYRHGAGAAPFGNAMNSPGGAN